MEAKFVVNNKMNQLADDSSSSFIAACSKSIRKSSGWGQQSSSPLSLNKPQMSQQLEDDDDDLSSSSCSTSASMDEESEEIAVWVKGEQRFISGITEQTSCGDLIEALLQDEGSTSQGLNQQPNPKDYVITERWKRVEQILDNKIKILKIWMTWGGAQSEVKFTLRRIDPNRDLHHLSAERDKDSGRGSPTGSVNSAIVRRRRHRASKSSVAWATHGQTVHPKSQKPNIERLMKLILEQGEVIQQQLSKLRDRELQICSIEEERHRLREREHGKNYLLETYLNGLHEADEKEQITGNSDSGINTEETTTSPEVGIFQSHEDDISDSPDIVNDFPTKRRTKSKREAELLQEHHSLKEFNASKVLDDSDRSSKVPSSDVTAEIEILEQMVVLNKHLQREEELMVRLGAKLKRYEADASGLTELQINEALLKVNAQLDNSSVEIQQMENELKCSDNFLQQKSFELQKLCEEIEDIEGNLIVSESNLNLSREYLAENIYNISKNIIKNSSIEYIRHTPEHMLATTSTQSLPHPSPLSCGTTTQVEVQIHQIPQETIINFPPFSKTMNSSDLLAQMNYLEKYNQRNSLIEQNSNNNNVMTATNIKLGPKKLINGACNNLLPPPTQNGDTNSDTGISSLGADDVTTLGTLV